MEFPIHEKTGRPVSDQAELEIRMLVLAGILASPASMKPFAPRHGGPGAGKELSIEMRECQNPISYFV